MVIRPDRSVLAGLACGALAGCTLVTDSFRTNDFSGDPFPIHIGRETGAVMIGVRPPEGSDLDAVLDVLSPVTLTDPRTCKSQRLVTSDLLLLGRSAPDGPFDVPRARLRAAEVISLHPCACPESEEEEPSSCAVGRPGLTQPFGAIVGANVLAGDALRLRLGDAQVFILADIGGDERDRTFACDAVFPSPYRGGGTLVISGTEVPFGGRRVTLETCLGNDPAQATQSARGGDALLVMSTGIGISLLSEPAYDRYREAALARVPAPTAPPPPLDQLPEASALLPSGPVLGRRAAIDRLALAAATSSSSRAPCRQVYAHHYLLAETPPPGDDFPCTTGTFCSVPAIVELAPPGGIEVLVVPDGDATLQALRAELRPDQPEVDGILGADTLRLTEIDVDYPHNRVLMRCTAPADQCVTRPALAAKEDRGQICRCVGPQVAHCDPEAR